MKSKQTQEQLILKGTEEFLKNQLRLLRADENHGHLGTALAKLQHCLRVVQGKENCRIPKRAASNPIPSSAGSASVDIPFKIGIVAQAVIPVIFGESRINQDDITYLESDEAKAAFASGAVSFIRPMITGERSERMDSNKRVRYYDPTAVSLVYNGNRYYLTKELIATGQKFNNLLGWIFNHGISSQRVIELCRQFQAGKMRSRKPLSRQKLRGGDSSPPAVEPSADKPGRHVRSFFRALSQSGFRFSPEQIQDGLDLKWTRRTFPTRTWVPLFSANPSKRHWKEAFVFGADHLYVSSQWYREQMIEFDEWAAIIAERAGIPFSPFCKNGKQKDSSSPAPSLSTKDNSSAHSNQVVIVLGSKKRRTVHIR